MVQRYNILGRYTNQYLCICSRAWSVEVSHGKIRVRRRLKKEHENEQISKKLDHGAEINKEILGDIQTTMCNTHNVQFTATLDDASVAAINNAGENGALPPTLDGSIHPLLSLKSA